MFINNVQNTYICTRIIGAQHKMYRLLKYRPIAYNIFGTNFDAILTK